MKQHGVIVDANRTSDDINPSYYLTFGSHML